MRSMLTIARSALQHTPPANPREPVRMFIVTEEMKRNHVAAADIVAAMSEAVKENTAMTERETMITDRFREGLETHRAAIEQSIAEIREAQKAADAENAAQIARLNDEITSRNAAHVELTAGNDARIADAERTMAGILAALDRTAPLPVDVMTNNGAFYDAIKRTPMGQDFHAAWKDRYAEFPTDPTLAAEPGGAKRLKAVPAAPAVGDQS